MREELFLGQRISIFFFFIQFLPHLSPLRASHISRKKIISVHRKLRTVSSTRCIYLLCTFIEHLGVLATPQVLGTRCEQDASQASGSSALEEEPGARDWKWPGVCEVGKCGMWGSDSPVCHLPYPLGRKTGAYSQGPEGHGQIYYHEAWAGDDGLELDSIGLICPILMKPREVVAGGVDGLATWPPMELQQVSYQRDGGGGSLSGAATGTWYPRDKSFL